jgi:hypothetical protein
MLTLPSLPLIPLPTSRPTLTRLLSLHAGRAYAAVWPFVRWTEPDQSPGPALARRGYQLLLVRDDGLLFLPGDAEPLAQPGAELSPLDPASMPAAGSLPAAPPFPAERLWSTLGLQAFSTSKRPDPAGVFQRLVAVLDRCFDLSGSLGGHSLHAEFLAAYLLATWFQPAFPSFGGLWLTGDHGSGKTRLLHLLVSLAHLGLLVPPATSAAVLRDLAALGASLAVDNAAFLSASVRSPKTHAARAAVLLAGPTAATLFPITQRGRPLAADGGGPRLRHVSVFGPRLFAALRPPHPTLLDRFITLHLVRAAGTVCALAHPHDPAAWPHPLGTLVDDLWALALSRLPELPGHLPGLARRARLPASAWPWHPPLAVAAWLDVNGLPGLFDRLAALARDYQAQLPAAPVDWTGLIVRALTLLADNSARVAANLAARSPRARAARARAPDPLARGVSRDLLPLFNPDGHDTPDITYPYAVTDQGHIVSHGIYSPSDPLADLYDVDDAQIPNADFSRLYAPFTFSTSAVAELSRRLADRLDWDLDPQRLTPNLVGLTLSQLRLASYRTSAERGWSITLPALVRLAQAYAIPLPPLLAQAAAAHAAARAAQPGAHAADQSASSPPAERASSSPQSDP